jgi:nicotinamide-nucleotide amidase
MVACICESLSRADAVICFGGLGPTQDDVTREAIAEIMGVDLVRDDAVADAIREMFAARDRRMPENNLRQAEVPAGATVIPQTRGTAPGLICPVRRKDGTEQVIYAVPGVPHEMKDMVERAVLPDLRQRAGEPATIVSRTLRTWGESESGLAELLDDHLRELHERGDVTLAFNASGIEGLRLRITAKGTDARAVETVIAAEESTLRNILGDLVFGVDDESMESVVLDMLRQRRWSLGLAESVTGGLVGARLTGIPGSSDVFRGAIVSYSTDVKQTVLGVSEGPVVSEPAALEMARGARRVLGSDVALALTGVAGPAEQDGMPAGTLCIGLVWPEGELTRTLRLPGRREQMRQFSVISSLDLLRRSLA